MEAFYAFEAIVRHIAGPLSMWASRQVSKTFAWLSDLLAISALVFAWLVCQCDTAALTMLDVCSEYARGPSAL